MTLASDKKTQIILDTIKCISHFGYSNFSMQDLAQLANVSKGIIHYYFLNKESLMMSVLEYVCTEIEKQLLENEHILDPIKRLSHIIWLRANIQNTHREYYKILMEFWTQTDQKVHVKLRLAKHYKHFRTLIMNAINYGIEKKIFHKNASLSHANLIIAITDGIALQWNFDRTLGEYDDLIKEYEHSIMKLLMQTVDAN